MSRRVYVYDPESKCLVELGARPPAEAHLELMLDSRFEGLRATDGTPIDSRTKYNAYMRQNGLAHVDDFNKGHWEKAQRARDAMARGDWGQKERTQAIREAYERVAHGYKPKVRQSLDGPDGSKVPIVQRFMPKE